MNEYNCDVCGPIVHWYAIRLNSRQENMLGSSEKVAAELKGSRLDFFPILFVAMRVMIMKTTTVATTAGSSDYCKTPYRMYFTRRQLCHRQLDEKKKKSLESVILLARATNT